MADDLNPAKRAELMAALGVVAKALPGLHDLVVPGVSIGDDLRSDLLGGIEQYERRAALIQAAIDKMDEALSELDALEADGYPTLDPIAIANSRYEELKEEVSDIEAAKAVFRSDIATGLSVKMGEPEDKPQTSSKE